MLLDKSKLSSIVPGEASNYKMINRNVLLRHALVVIWTDRIFSWNFLLIISRTCRPWVLCLSPRSCCWHDAWHMLNLDTFMFSSSYSSATLLRRPLVCRSHGSDIDFFLLLPFSFLFIYLYYPPWGCLQIGLKVFLLCIHMSVVLPRGIAPLGCRPRWGWHHVFQLCFPFLFLFFFIIINVR